MMMSEEEATWIWSEYRDCGLFAAIDRFAKDVSGIDGVPAGHPSLLFYLAVYAIDEIKCIVNSYRRLERCRNLRNDIVHYLKINGYDNHKELAAEAIYCVQYGLEALTFMRCIKEICIMPEHINELVSDQNMKAEIRKIARKCFGGEEFKEWINGYYDGRDFISETIISKLKEMRKANPPKEEIVKKKGKGNRNKELFTDENLKRQMVEELKKLFNERGLKMTEIKVTKNSKELNCIVEFYGNMIENKIIEDDVYPRSYIRFLKEGGFSFAVSDKTVEGRLRIKLRKT